MDMLSYLLGKNNGGGNPAKRFDYIIDARGVISLNSAGGQITDAGLLAQLNQILEDGVYGDNYTLKTLKIGLYIDGHFEKENPNVYCDNLFLESICIKDSTQWDSDESVESGYLRYSIDFVINNYNNINYFTLEGQINPDEENKWWLLVKTIN